MQNKKKLILSGFLSIFMILSNFSQGEPRPAPTYDFLIRDALIYDGQDLRGKKADLAILGDKIVAIGNLKDKNAFQVINAKSWILAPGFIDAHTHSDFNPIIYPDLNNKVTQGVTTEVVGNCGMSAAPVLGLHVNKVREVWAREGATIPDKLPWQTFAEYRERMQQAGMSTNIAALIGHGNLRSAVMGYSSRAATPSEILQMKRLLERAMQEGAFGISYGLIYLPGIFANHEELTELCHEAGRLSGICAFHMRSESSKLIEAIQEVLDIAERTKSPIQISHLKAGGKKNWPKIDEAFELIQRARERGLRIQADAYPYQAGFAELGVVLPDKLFQRQDRNAYFKDIFKREALLNELRTYYAEINMQWDSVMIASTRHKRYWPYEGKTLKQIARQTNKEPERLLIEILADTNFEVSAFFFSQNPAVIERVISKNYVAVGSDSVADGSRKPHPRAYGTFPRILKTYVRERKMMSLGEAIRKMTSMPADHFGIQGRGRIQVGQFADIVLFDAGDIADRADYEHPNQLSKGVKWVFVNGRAVVMDGQWNGEKNGRFLSRL